MFFKVGPSLYLHLVVDFEITLRVISKTNIFEDNKIKVAFNGRMVIGCCELLDANSIQSTDRRKFPPSAKTSRFLGTF